VPSWGKAVAEQERDVRRSRLLWPQRPQADWPADGLRSSSGSLAMLAAIRRASSRVSSLGAARRPGSSSVIDERRCCWLAAIRLLFRFAF